MEPISLTDPNGRTEVIDLSKAKVLTNPNCIHEFELDPTDQTDFYAAEMCKHCPIGRLVAK